LRIGDDPLVIVRDAGDAWQLVLQTDHADLAAGFARSWDEQGPRHDSLVLAAERHDDGWAVWEASPLVDGEGAPVTFLDVQVPSHLTFYRAMIAAVSDEDAYAGLLVAMHGAGIYRHRYGEDPGLQLTHAPAESELVEAFVEEQEDGFGARMAAAQVDDEQRWADYRRLQAYDRLSLAFCMRPWDEPREPFDVGDLRVEPLAPWRATITPYPFTAPSVALPLLRRMLPKRAWTQAEFHDAFAATPPEAVDVLVES
jgi:Protein of unknown function (DUF3891)